MKDKKINNYTPGDWRAFYSPNENEFAGDIFQQKRTLPAIARGKRQHARNTLEFTTKDEEIHNS